MWACLLDMSVAMCAMRFLVGYVYCNVWYRVSCWICFLQCVVWGFLSAWNLQKTVIFSFRINCFMNSRPKDTNNNSKTILCCMFVAMCGVCKSSGEALGALGQLSELWESFGSSGKPLGALPELWEL